MDLNDQLSGVDYVRDRWKEMRALHPKVEGEGALWRLFLRKFERTCIGREWYEMRIAHIISSSAIGFVYLKLDDEPGGETSFIFKSVEEVPVDLLTRCGLLRETEIAERSRQGRYEVQFRSDAPPVACRFFAKVRKGMVNRFINSVFQ